MRNRLFPILLMLVLLTLIILPGCVPNKEENDKPDTNTYLGEETTFANKAIIKVTGIAVEEKSENLNTVDKDGDYLSEYVLEVNVQLTHNGSKRSKKIKPSMFSVKSINLKANTNGLSFIKAAFNATLDVAATLVFQEDVNLLEETANFIVDYVSYSIEDIEQRGRPIKLDDDAFEPFVLGPNDNRNLKLSFPIKQTYLESDNALVLAIDTFYNIEKRIVLTIRPETN